MADRWEELCPRRSGDCPGWSCWICRETTSAAQSPRRSRTARLDLLPNLTSIRLFDNSLEGSIPPSIGALRRLNRLRLDGNNLDGFIPAEIGNCSSLGFFQVYNNRLQGGLPREIGLLQRLTHLSVYNNRLTGTLPVELGGCVSLRRLTINGNSFQGPIPAELGGLANLNEFQASGCNFTGSLPPELGSLGSLSMLDVSNNRLSGQLATGLGSSWSQIVSLNLSSNEFTGPVPDSFGAMLMLESLDLSVNGFTGQLPASLGLLSNLSVLSVSRNSFQGPLPPQLGLEFLNASSNNFSGTVPPGLCSNRNLMVLDLSNNRIEGNLLALENCSWLQTLNVSNNAINGSFPQLSSLRLETVDLSMNQMRGTVVLNNQLANLTSLLIGGNRFSGPLPDGLFRLPVLEALNTSWNSFQGGLPALISLTGLHTLDLSHNAISDTIPDYFSTFSALELLDLSTNNFSGDIPSSLESLTRLDRFNFSNNQLSGRIPQITLFATAPASAFINNLNLCGPPLARECNADQPPAGTPVTPLPGRRRRRRSIGRTVGLVFIVLGGAFLAATALFLLCAYKALNRKKTTVSHENKFADRVPMLYAEIQKATEDFGEANVIGKGPHGTVYKGIFAWEKILAVKVVRSDQESEDSKNTYYYTAAARKLNRIRHPNVVKLEDFLVYRGARIFLYEYMPNKSLGETLQRQSGPKLHWNTRYKIALGAAQGLSYLHHQYSIVHCDIKSSNVLLDSAFGARIADVGLAKLHGDTRNLACMNKFFGYTAPEATKVSQKADVYSFGVVLLELLTGRRPVMDDGTSIVSWVRDSIADDRPLSDIVDPILSNTNGPFQEEISTVFKIALICTDSSSTRRPSMKDVVEVLSRMRREPEGPKLRSLRSFIHSRSFVLLNTRDHDQ